MNQAETFNHSSHVATSHVFRTFDRSMNGNRFRPIVSDHTDPVHQNCKDAFPCNVGSSPFTGSGHACEHKIRFSEFRATPNESWNVYHSTQAENLLHISPHDISFLSFDDVNGFSHIDVGR